MTERDEAGSAGSPADAQHARELDALHRASHFLHRLRDPEVLARDVITLLRDVVHHDFAAVYLVDGDRLQTFAVSDRGLGADTLAADKAYLQSLDLRVGKNITGWVAQHGESVLLDDASRDPRYLDSQVDIESELCVPMRSGDSVIGVVNLESTRKGAYGESDQRVLEIVANQIAIAVENARLVERKSEVERLRMLADLTGGVAHDLGNMLVASALRCDLLRMRGNLSDAQLEELLAIRTVLGKSVDLARSLLRLGLPQSAAAEDIDLNQHLRHVLPLLEALGGDRMSVTLDLCADETHVVASPGHIDQILINLAVNSREAVGRGGRLWIRTRCGSGAKTERDGRPAPVMLELRDDGRGMTPDTLDRALQPLFTTRKEGSGLGLATVARLVEELGGTIALESVHSEGTVVRIELPAKSPAHN